MDKIRITCQVLNGATGEVREVVANVRAENETDAVGKLFAIARKDDMYYRFLGMDGVLIPVGGESVKYSGQEYWARA